MDVNQIDSNVLIILRDSSALIDSAVQVYIPNCAAIHQDTAIYMLRLKSERNRARGEATLCEVLVRCVKLVEFPKLSGLYFEGANRYHSSEAWLKSKDTAEESESWIVI